MGKRGRPPKFDRPSRLVAMRLPEDVITRLRLHDPDLAKAVVSLVSGRRQRGLKATTPSEKAAELVHLGRGRFLISIDRRAIRQLPGCDLVPFGSEAAFVALKPGHGLADLALAVVERLEEPRLADRERDALLKLRAALRAWKQDPALSYETRSIVVMRSRSPSISHS